MKSRWSFGVGIVAIFAALAIFGPVVAPYDPLAIDLRHAYELPSADHWLGTSDNGVDILSVILHGARLAGIVGTLVVGFSLLTGIVFGAWAGMSGRRVDQVVMGAADLVQAFPHLVLQIAIVAVIARPGVVHIVIALASTGWVLYARIARAQALQLREMEFVEAARALGMSNARVIGRHVIPNLLPPLTVQASAGFAAAIIAESTLSFLGLGPGTGTSWGAMLNQGTGVLLRFPHVALVSVATIGITVLGFNLAGDWLRDRLDPKA